MNIDKQKEAPIYTALEQFRRRRVVPFDVPGHKRGQGNPELVALLGQQCVGIDVNSMKPLDNLCHPVSVIKEAEELAADAFGAAHAFFMVAPDILHLVSRNEMAEAVVIFHRYKGE